MIGSFVAVGRTFVFMAVVLMPFGLHDFCSADDQVALAAGPTMRGSGQDLQMLVRGEVVDEQGEPATDITMSVSQRSQFGLDSIPVKLIGATFETWIPIGSSRHFYYLFEAATEDGRLQVCRGVSNLELRTAAIEGLQLQLLPADRPLDILVQYQGAPVADAFVTAFAGARLLEGKTDQHGHAIFQVCEGEKLTRVTAWTDDFRIGGFQIGSKPHRDPRGSEFTVDMVLCRAQKICLKSAVDGTPVPNLSFQLILGSGPPNYNYYGTPLTFPHCSLLTNDDGVATCQWFPDEKTHGAYVEIAGDEWVTAGRNDEWEIGEDGSMVLKLKKVSKRMPLQGRVVSDGTIDVSGLMVQIRTFQSEEKGRSDHVTAFTDQDGKFEADCVADATYCMCVTDPNVTSDIVDLIPFKTEGNQVHPATLMAEAGQPVEIHLTAGSGYEPVRNQSVSLRTNHHYTWVVDGKEQGGTGGRMWHIQTDENGIARAVAKAGSEIRASVFAGDWRSGEYSFLVQADGVTRFDIHRETAEPRQIDGVVLAEQGLNISLADTQIVLGSTDGENEEFLTATTDGDGRFVLQSKSNQFGLLAYTADGKASGSVITDGSSFPIKLQLSPTSDFRGRLTDGDGLPVAGRTTRPRAKISGVRDSSKTIATSFEAKEFKATTDSEGNFTLANLPTELEMSLQLDDTGRRLGKLHLIFGEDRPRQTYSIDRTTSTPTTTLAKLHDATLRDAVLGDFHVLVIVADEKSMPFVRKYVTNHDEVPDVMSYLNLTSTPNWTKSEAAASFAKARNWPKPISDSLFLCALNSSGDELGRLAVDLTSEDAAKQAAEFLRLHKPSVKDAEEKWNAAFAEAKRSNRKVWARISQRYCSPCFRLARWLDDHRKLIEKDYVLLKVDNARDKNGIQVAKRIMTEGKRLGIPFQAIFDAEGNLLIDSEGPLGNIGYPSSYESRRHLSNMLQQTRQRLTDDDIDHLSQSLKK